MLIRNPSEWGGDQLGRAAVAVGSVFGAIHRPDEDMHAPPAVRKIGTAELKSALVAGFQDFAACRTDVIFLCFLYPIIGLVLARLVIGYGMFELMFPVASGFALIGPFIGVGLYEMSRQREQGREVSWAAAFDVLRSPSTGAIALLGLVLFGAFFAWVYTAQSIYDMTLGPHHPASWMRFAQDVFTTSRGWTLIGVGVGVGFFFALLVFAISAVSFPLLLDRPDVGVVTAVGTSIRALLANPGTMALWGLIVAVSLAIGSIPFFVGLAVVIPVLGHATWHLYRQLVVPRS
jgi:uncharacterized membrane protein